MSSEHNWSSNKSQSLRRRVSESIYRPNFYRQRSSSCGDYRNRINGTICEDNYGYTDDTDSSDDRRIRIQVIRRTSLSVNMNGISRGGVAANGGVCPLEAVDEIVPSTTPTIARKASAKNELIISIPVLIDDDNSSINNAKFKEAFDPPFARREPEMQSSWTVLKQMLIPFLIAGIGSVGAGIVLNSVQHSDSFVAIPQLIIMVPSFLGLIGNIETTLASRLSTHANLGTLDVLSQLKAMVVGNAAVVLCQAASVGLFAAFASLGISYIKTPKETNLDLGQLVLLLCASSVSTSVVANVILATAITLVIIVARKIDINPDNIATPIAASMGDVCTISILAIISDFLYKNTINGRIWIAVVVLTVLLLSAPITGFIARRNRYTKSVILTGWTPILGAVIIEQPGGLVMESAFDKYDVMSTFQPLVNGIGSNLVGIQTSRLSTFLHQTAPKGKLPKSNPRACVQPCATFFGSDVHARMARLLLGITVPAHALYLVIIRLWQRNFIFTVPFVAAYMVAVIAQIAILLYLAYVSVLWAWKRHINPDNSAIPFTSALADVFGNCLMAAAFTFLNAIDDPNARFREVMATSANATFSTVSTFADTTNSSL
ncbi:unnamed protein product, partial [Medioppia subpectinata]